MKKLLTITALSLLGAAIGQAQDRSPLQATYIHHFRHNDSSVGSVSIERLDLRGGVPLINEGGGLLALGFSYGLDHYDFKGTTADWGSVHHVRLGLASNWKVDDEWTWSNYGSLGYSSEEGSNKNDGLAFSYVSTLEYKVNDRLKIGPGVGFSSKINQDLSIYPVIAIEWNINDEWKLASGPSDVADAGANIYVEYTPKSLQEKWQFTGGFYYLGNSFKLANDGTTKDRAAEERLITLYGGASYSMDSGVKLSLITGYHLFQSYGVFDKAGNELSKEILKDAPFVGIAVGFDF